MFSNPQLRSSLTVLVSVTLLGGAISVVPEAAIAARPCETYSLDHPEIPPWGDFTNCPLLQGEFVSDRWRIILDTVGTGVYSYEGIDRRTGNAIYLSGREVRGTEDRPVYTFRNGDTAYTVAFRSNDHNTIRVQVYQRGRRILNELLTRP